MRNGANDLTPRILEAVHAAEADNEILISWIQAALVALLAALYFASSKAFHMDVPIEPVPIVLEIYAPFVGLRLILARRRRLGPRLLALSVVMDVATLATLIWCFHIQYRQPAAFYLKVPTFAYFFIFIALRSLRYDVRYVVLTGLAAIAAWASLLGYALVAGEATITRDFVRYVMGYDVLIGAEIDKMVSLAMVTAVLAIGVARSRRLLAMAAYESQARSDLSRFFSPEVASRILAAASPIRPGEGEVRPAVTMTIDIRGFTKYASRVDPGEVMRLLADYQKRMVGVIFRHGGTIDKFLGDGILAHFGAATPSPTSAADALRAVEALCETGERWRRELAAEGRDLDFGLSCAFGDVIFGAVGDDERLEYTVIGDPVNLAAKLEKHTKVARVRALTTRETVNVARSQGYTPSVPLRDLAAEAVEGVATPLDLVVLQERAAPASPGNP
ncbi:MAG: adenylate/guanylate cyclase domain-containing protein [Candidatus Binatia bacterium]